MSYTLPTFNIIVNIWRHGTLVSHPPDDVALGNLTPGRRVSRWLPNVSAPNTWLPVMTILFPYGTDVRGEADTGGLFDTVECPAGSGRYYDVVFVDYVALGFANQHMFAVVKQSGPFPPGPPASGDLLLEDGTLLLLEDGSSYLLEP